MYLLLSVCGVLSAHLLSAALCCAGVLRLVLAVVAVGEDEKTDDTPWKEVLHLEFVRERLPALLECLQDVSLACVVVAEDLCGGEHTEVHFRRNPDLEVEVARVAGGCREAILEACVRVRLVLEAEAGFELVDGCLEDGKVRWLEALDAAVLAVHDDEHGDGLELLRGHEAEHELVVERALVVHHCRIRRRHAQVHVVCERRLGSTAPARGDNTHVQELRQEGVGSAYYGNGLRLRRAAARGGEIGVAEGGQQLQVVGDEALARRLLWKLHETLVQVGLHRSLRGLTPALHHARQLQRGVRREVVYVFSKENWAYRDLVVYDFIVKTRMLRLIILQNKTS